MGIPVGRVILAISTVIAVAAAVGFVLVVFLGIAD
jgi:hypothetical protein